MFEHKANIYGYEVNLEITTADIALENGDKYINTFEKWQYKHIR